ncbi:metal-binding protein [Bacillus velezensis]|uniref:metal-binding protein n=1 Tax=Bacillus TaxID=1386 RepID=UPI0013EED28C|nr:MULTISPECIES: metal-binding protein [Bacillus]KAF6601846.1 metal-binding protein [Bacillus sp. EKM420B]KAF6606249.1 metal-binding protein [Bacillus sp. EKM417B]QRV08444.1 metal-binding protein [Bacillus velezensis]WGD68393.1 metal-binding protein [Bacillus velezensis]
MVVTGDYQCNVCKGITRIKVQLGWLDKYPVRIRCGNCKISIYGNVYLDQKNAGYSIKLKNVNPLDPGQLPDFIVEVSGELLTDKIRIYTESKSDVFSPFFKNGVFVMGENIEHFKRSTLLFLYKIDNEWPIVKRINELWFNESHGYLRKELHNVLDKTPFPVDNELELLRAVHFLNTRFIQIFAGGYFKKITDHIFNELKNINSTQLLLLANHFENNLGSYEKKLFNTLDKFVQKFHMFIPIFGLDFYSDIKHREESIKQLGLTTVDFEDIKDFYTDTFEDISDVLNLIVAYNNLKHRGDFKEMKSNVIDSIQEIKDYQKMQKKGRKLEFINGQESFDKIFVSKVDNRLRNAIAHRSYIYNVDTQKLKYYPSGDVSRGSTESLYLTEFIQECFKLMRTCIGLAEIVYQTRKFSYINKGIEARPFNHYFPSSEKKRTNPKRKTNQNKNKKKNLKKLAKKNRKINKKK